MKKEVRKALINANKEVRSLSGVCKIIRHFWKDGYKAASLEFGLTFADFADVPGILSRMQKNGNGEVFVTLRRKVKDEQGLFALDKEGKQTYEEYDKVISTWTASTLFKVLEQSTAAK